MGDPGEKRALTSAMPVVDSRRDSPTVRAFDLLRTRLRQTTQKHGWRNIAVASPTPGCGNTFTAVNLALSMSRIPGSRTVLMDFNLRQPGVAKAFDMQSPGMLRDYLDVHFFQGPPPGRKIATLPMPAQPQGEAVTWTPDGSALLTASEGDNRILRVEIPWWVRAGMRPPDHLVTSVS